MTVLDAVSSFNPVTGSQCHLAKSSSRNLRWKFLAHCLGWRSHCRNFLLEEPRYAASTRCYGAYMLPYPIVWPFNPFPHCDPWTFSEHFWEQADPSGGSLVLSFSRRKIEREPRPCSLNIVIITWWKLTDLVFFSSFVLVVFLLLFDFRFQPMCKPVWAQRLCPELSDYQNPRPKR